MYSAGRCGNFWFHAHRRTRTGTQFKTEYRTPDMVKWPEECQEKALEEQLTAVLSREDISGVYSI